MCPSRALAPFSAVLKREAQDADHPQCVNASFPSLCGVFPDQSITCSVCLVLHAGKLIENRRGRVGEGSSLDQQLLRMEKFHAERLQVWEQRRKEITSRRSKHLQLVLAA